MIHLPRVAPVSVADQTSSFHVQVGVDPLRCLDMDYVVRLTMEAKSVQKSASAGLARRVTSSFQSGEIVSRRRKDK